MGFHEKNHGYDPVDEKSYRMKGEKEGFRSGPPLDAGPSDAPPPYPGPSSQMNPRGMDSRQMGPPPNGYGPPPNGYGPPPPMGGPPRPPRGQFDPFEPLNMMGRPDLDTMVTHSRLYHVEKDSSGMTTKWVLSKYNGPSLQPVGTVQTHWSGSGKNMVLHGQEVKIKDLDQFSGSGSIYTSKPLSRQLAEKSGTAKDGKLYWRKKKDGWAWVVLRGHYSKGPVVARIDKSGVLVWEQKNLDPGAVDEIVLAAMALTHDNKAALNSLNAIAGIAAI